MTNYALVNPDTQAVVAYPYNFDRLRRDNPYVSFPREPGEAFLQTWNLYPVSETPKPVYDPSKLILEGTPVWDQGILNQVWTEIPAPTELIEERTQEEAESVHRAAIKADSFVQNFVAMTPSEVTAYVDVNITNLTSAKAVIEKLSLMVWLLARREFDES